MALDPTQQSGTMNRDETISPLLLKQLYLGNCNVNISSAAISPLKLDEQKRILVTGGAGFVGSHLVDRLMLMGHKVMVVDNFYTGSMKNIAHWIGHANFSLVEHDVQLPLTIECDQIYHLACPASPSHYQTNPIKTVKTSVLGTMNMLGLAKRVGARFLLASTSEVYGDPEMHPQPEEYRGSVNTVGIRACYDEGKRCAETLTYCYERQYGVEVRVARIFNAFGPRMDKDDGRVVSNFILQALRGEKMTVYGNGKQTRSFQYILDLVRALIALMESDHCLPVNIGNPEEYEINEFALLVKELLNSSSDIIHTEGVPDDPQQRKPDIKKAQEILGWNPKYSLREGLVDTIEYFRKLLEQESRQYN